MKLSFLFACVSVRARKQFSSSEVDTYLKLTSMVRVIAEAKDDRDGGDSKQATTGPSIQLFLKRLLRLKRITILDLDDSKPRSLVLECLLWALATVPKRKFSTWIVRWPRSAREQVDLDAALVFEGG
jgi:hypothetical protein